MNEYPYKNSIMEKVRVHDVLFHTFSSLLCCQYFVVIFKYDVPWTESYSYSFVHDDESFSA